MNNNNSMICSQELASNTCTSVVNQGNPLGKEFYEAVRTQFLQQSALYLEAAPGYMTKSADCTDLAA